MANDPEGVARQQAEAERVRALYAAGISGPEAAAALGPGWTSGATTLDGGAPTPTPPPPTPAATPAAPAQPSYQDTFRAMLNQQSPNLGYQVAQPGPQPPPTGGLQPAPQPSPGPQQGQTLGAPPPVPMGGVPPQQGPMGPTGPTGAGPTGGPQGQFWTGLQAQREAQGRQGPQPTAQPMMNPTPTVQPRPGQFQRPGPLGSFAQGGRVPRTGTFKLHKGEIVVPTGQPCPVCGRV